MMATDTADVVIIGGGVIGIATAFFLAQRKAGQILVVEQNTVGSGSTGRSVASIDLFSFQPAAIPLQMRAFEIFQNFKELVGGDCGLVTTGFAALVGPAQVAALHQTVALNRAGGLDVEQLTPAEFTVLEPAASDDGLAAAVYSPSGGYGDPMLTTNAFSAAARRNGVVIQQGRAVTGLTHRGGRVTGLETNLGPVAAPVVVCAAGPWSRHLLTRFGCDTLGLYACWHPVIAMQRPPHFTGSQLSILDLPNQIYARPESGGLALAGSIDPAVGYSPVDPQATPGGDQPDYTFWVAERLVRRYPALEAGALRRGWAGLMTIAPDWQPVLGALPELSGLYCATGFSGQGFKIAPAVGDLLAGLIAGESTSAELLAPFRPTRFAEGRPLTSSGFVGLG